MKKTIMIGCASLISPLISNASDVVNLTPKLQLSVPVICSAKTTSITPISLKSLEVKYKELCNGPAYSLQLTYSGENENSQLVQNGTSQSLSSEGHITISTREGAYYGASTIELTDVSDKFRILSLNVVPTDVM